MQRLFVEVLLNDSTANAMGFGSFFARGKVTSRVVDGLLIVEDEAGQRVCALPEQVRAVRVELKEDP